MSGPLAGLKVVEMAGLGPAPFAGMMLADLGAEVVVVDRLSPSKPSPDQVRTQIARRGKKSISLDLKKPEAVEAVLKLIEQADILLEGFRPGVMERIGLGPDVCLARRPSLVYGRMTGWGQSGPMAQAAGHDINYIALTGALHAIGTHDKPVPPLNVVGDFGGGGMLLVVGVLSGVFHARLSGKGQVVDAAMTDGSALLMGMMYGFKANGQWTNQRESNMLDGGAHFYGTYECADGKWVAIGSIEPQFYALLAEKTGIALDPPSVQMDKKTWPAMKDKLAAIFKTRPRQSWCDMMEGSDVCFAPVLDLDEAPLHPHNVARDTFIERAGVVQPAPAPRFSHSHPSVRRDPVAPGHDTQDILRQTGLSEQDIAKMLAAGVAG